MCTIHRARSNGAGGGVTHFNVRFECPMFSIHASGAKESAESSRHSSRFWNKVGVRTSVTLNKEQRRGIVWRGKRRKSLFFSFGCK